MNRKKSYKAAVTGEKICDRLSCSKCNNTQFKCFKCDKNIQFKTRYFWSYCCICGK